MSIHVFLFAYDQNTYAVMRHKFFEPTSSDIYITFRLTVLTFVRMTFRMYCNGLNPNVEALYDPIDFPVSSGTPPLHTLCSWNHEEEWSIIDVAVLVRKRTL